MLGNQKSLFSLPEDLHFLNCASRAPLLNKAQALGVAGLRWQIAPSHVGPDEYARESEELRRAVADLINGSPDQIAITPSVSYGVAIAAHNLRLRSGQNVVSMEEEFPSMDGDPFEYHWSNRAGSHDTTATVYRQEYDTGARRFDVGEHANTITVPMLTEGVRQAMAWGSEAIQDYCTTLTGPWRNSSRTSAFRSPRPHRESRTLSGFVLPMRAASLRSWTRLSSVRFAYPNAESAYVYPLTYSTRRRTSMHSRMGSWPQPRTHETSRQDKRARHNPAVRPPGRKNVFLNPPGRATWR